MSEPQHVHLPTSRRGDTNAYCSICGYFPLPLDAARLSHDRGADAKVNALLALIEHGDWEESEGGTVYVGPGEVVVSVATLRAALSVPAPTLPALDADPGMALAGALEAAHWHLDGEDVDRVIEELTKRGYRLEALRDAV
jgi:hypothetical protein